MNLFLRYLRGRLPLIGLYLALCALFTGSLLLYQLPVRAVLYPAGLCLLLLALYLGLDFYHSAETHRLLERAARFPKTLPPLPDAAALTERDLLAVI